MGAYWTVQACAREMTPGSSIVNVASTLALIAPPAPENACASSKSGPVGLIRDLSALWAGGDGIRVKRASPGYVKAETTEDVPDEMPDRIVGSRSPLKRWEEPAEITAEMLAG